MSCEVQKSFLYPARYSLQVLKASVSSAHPRQPQSVESSPAIARGRHFHPPTLASSGRRVHPDGRASIFFLRPVPMVGSTAPVERASPGPCCDYMTFPWTARPGWPSIARVERGALRPCLSSPVTGCSVDTSHCARAPRHRPNPTDIMVMRARRASKAGMTLHPLLILTLFPPLC